jgi:hypothetical protein
LPNAPAVAVGAKKKGTQLIAGRTLLNSRLAPDLRAEQKQRILF